MERRGFFSLFKFGKKTDPYAEHNNEKKVGIFISVIPSRGKTSSLATACPTCHSPVYQGYPTQWRRVWLPTVALDEAEWHHVLKNIWVEPKCVWSLRTQINWGSHSEDWI